MNLLLFLFFLLEISYFSGRRDTGVPQKLQPLKERQQKALSYNISHVVKMAHHPSVCTQWVQLKIFLWIKSDADWMAPDLQGFVLLCYKKRGSHHLLFKHLGLDIWEPTHNRTELSHKVKFLLDLLHPAATRPDPWVCCDQVSGRHQVHLPQVRGRFFSPHTNPCCRIDLFVFLPLETDTENHLVSLQCFHSFITGFLYSKWPDCCSLERVF